MASTSKAATDPGSTTSTSQKEVVSTTIVEDIVVVKCGLRSVIALKDKEYAILSATIEQHVELVSKMMRRCVPRKRHTRLRRDEPGAPPPPADARRIGCLGKAQPRPSAATPAFRTSTL